MVGLRSINSTEKASRYYEQCIYINLLKLPSYLEERESLPKSLQNGTSVNAHYRVRNS